MVDLTESEDQQMKRLAEELNKLDRRRLENLAYEVQIVKAIEFEGDDGPTSVVTDPV
ncbi:hypothetical protein [Pseudomonas brassicacearum]|uniref:hypothetical protein n=1 Tax=Pseudomonas brassicacearum TaxID=930166 RepID=UPI00160AE8EA|nr:hypothetical protein [Pseudomonas brassicacearum]